MKFHDFYREMNFFKENLVCNCDFQDFLNKKRQIPVIFEVFRTKQNTVKYIRYFVNGIFHFAKYGTKSKIVPPLKIGVSIVGIFINATEPSKLYPFLSK